MSESPWSRYSKDPLPKDLAYPVGRDVVQQHLATAGAAVFSLSFGRPDRHSLETVLSIYWSGDVARRIADVIPPGGFLLMTLLAVPAREKPAIGQALRGQWLAEASEWIAGTTNQGDAWRATDHRWLLSRTAAELRLSIE